MTKPVKFSVLANVQEFDQFKQICYLADELGYHSIALGDHLSWSVFDPWIALSAAATITERIILSQLVINNIYRHPTVLAKIAASVDRISNGRLELGLGAGSKHKEEYLTYGIPYYDLENRASRLQETIQILKGMWHNSEFFFDGEYYVWIKQYLTLSLCRKPFHRSISVVQVKMS